MTGSDTETGPAMEQSGARSTGPIRSVSVVSTGSVQIHPQQPNGSRLPLMAWLVGSRRWTPPRPINAYVIEHANGLILFDTGQDRASVTDPDYFPGGVTGFLYGRLARFRIAPEETLAAKLAALGHGASDVRLAILSHLHPSTPGVTMSPDPSPGPKAGAGRGRRLSRAERLGLYLGRGLDKRLTPLGRWLYRRTRGGITRPWKVDALLLTTRGRRSGRERTVVLQFFRDGDDMILAAANDGGASHPGWYFNPVADPAARVEVMGRTIAVRAEELPADEAAAWWTRILVRAPSYERYARATSRRIPIVRLVRAREAG